MIALCSAGNLWATKLKVEASGNSNPEQVT